MSTATALAPFGCAAAAALLLSGLTAPGAQAMPTNPLRPLASETCDEALARLAEARIGSPLLPASELDDVVRVAEGHVVRLCGRDAVPDALPLPATDPQPQPETEPETKRHTASAASRKPGSRI